MANVVRVALPGFNALTDTNPAHFSLFVGGTTNQTLVKEQSRGTASVSSFNEGTVVHGIGYYPYAMSATEVNTGEYEWIYNAFGGAYNPYYMYVTTQNIVFGNQDSVTKPFTYSIFYDNL